MRAAAKLIVLIGLSALAWGALQPWPRAPLPARAGPAFTAARSWGLQLQNVVALSIPPAVDALVVDYSRDGSDRQALTPARVAPLKRRTGAPDRIVLCYLSIGEAENYRYYWNSAWGAAPPSWLGKENTEWKGNFQVRYWQQDWQRLIVDPAPSAFAHLTELIDPAAKPYIDRIIEAGFDGVYLDRIDAFAEWQSERGKTAEADMIAFVRRIADYAHARKPGFLVVAQNGEELLESRDYRAALDGVAKEDFVFGVLGEEQPNPPEMVDTTKRLLLSMAGDGKPVMVVEYLQSPQRRLEALREITPHGFLPLFASRALNTPPEPVSASSLPGAPTGSAR